jgi:ComF family protein
VPLHPRRLVARGYNQALELARRIARRMQIELAPHAAKRIRLTEDQIGKSAAQRRRNVRGAFAVTQSLDGQHVALLDDVMTTGATLGELARMCRKAGAARVEVWAAARVE